MDAAEEEVRVLFVEDDPALADMYRAKLELDGYLVEIANDGAQALESATSNPPDLVFLGIRLPETTGIHVLEQLRAREHTKNLPVVILSSSSDPEWHERVRRLGAMEWLVKPTTTPRQVAGWAEGWSRTSSLRPDNAGSFGRNGSRP